MSKELRNILSRLTLDQKRFVVIRPEFRSDKAAAQAIGIPPGTVYNWRKEDAPIDDAVSLVVDDGLSFALEMRRQSLVKAMAVKARGLDSEDEKVRQSVATEIIEWELGKAAQHVDVEVREREQRRAEFQEMVRKLTEDE